MPDHASARKRVRRNARRAEINGARVSRIRTFIKKVEEAITAGDQKAAQTALQATQSEMYRGVAKGVMKKNTVARKMSRLSSRIKALKKA